MAAVEAAGFDVDGFVFSVEPIGNGFVNDTYLAIYRTFFSEERVVIQRINTNVFKQPAHIMENMHKVTEHIHTILKKEYPESDRIWQIPKIIPAKDGKDYYIDEQGRYWRAITHIASAQSYDKIQNPSQAYEVGAVLGHFHHAIADMDGTGLYDTLPGFHVTPHYLRELDRVLGTEEGQEHLKSSKVAMNVLKFIEDRREWCSVLENAKDRGELKCRVIHGDPRASNIMIDNATGKGTCIIDLDTVKPGLIHYDIGDCFRSCCNPLGEGAREISKVNFDLDLCAALVDGYKSQAKDTLTEADRHYLYDGIRLIAFELSLRFFTDFLAGDVYFKVHEEGQNLLRSRVQMQECRCIEASEAAIRRILGKM